MLERIQETAAYLKGKMHTHPETAIIPVSYTHLTLQSRGLGDVYKRQS